jgi:hypothetical protein
VTPRATRWIDAFVLGVNLLAVVLNAWARDWALVLLGVVTLAVVRMLQVLRDKFSVERDAWLARLGEAKADEAIKAKMVAEVELAIKAGRVSFGGEVVSRETQH